MKLVSDVVIAIFKMETSLACHSFFFVNPDSAWQGFQVSEFRLLLVN